MRGRGFTLIEVMICIAILAIVIATPLNAWSTLGAVTRDREYRLAYQAAQYQVERIRDIPFDRLPPREITVPRGGRVDLGQEGLVPGSLLVRDLEGRSLGPPAEADPGSGRIRLDPGLAGRRVVVDYRFRGTGRGEAHTVPAAAPHAVILANHPVAHVDRILAAAGDRLETLPEGAWRLDPATGVLRLPPRLAGRVVLADYAGDRIRLEVGGQFRDGLLLPQSRPGPFKLALVDVTYGDGASRVALSVLKVRP